VQPNSRKARELVEEDHDMKIFVSLCGAAAVTLMMAGCGSTPADTHAADVKAITNEEAQWNQDYAAKDLEKIVSHYADDGVLIVSGVPPSNGKDAIRSALQQMIADPAMTLTFKAAKVDVAKSGDLGYSQGSYQLTVTDPVSHKVVNDHGSYVTTYRKQANGAWKAVADIAASEVPPATPSVSKHSGSQKHGAAKHSSQKKRRGKHA
jgi:uncharacterized protein (TIGR02246 family)